MPENAGESGLRVRPEEARSAVDSGTTSESTSGLTIASETSDEATDSTKKEPPEPLFADPDEALRMAIKAAVDAGNLERAKALLAVLEATPPPIAQATTRSNIVSLTTKRGTR